MWLTFRFLGWPIWPRKILILDVVTFKILTIWQLSFWSFGHGHGQKSLTAWLWHAVKWLINNCGRPTPPLFSENIGSLQKTVLHQNIPYQSYFRRKSWFWFKEDGMRNEERATQHSDKLLSKKARSKLFQTYTWRSTFVIY